MTTERGSKRQLSALLGLALLLSASSTQAAEPALLFNGKDLSRFTTWLRKTKDKDPQKVFSVVDGTIRISGAGYGYLATKESYENYRLTLEYRWGKQKGLDRKALGREGKALDSGVFLHASGPDGNSHDGKGAFMAAIECNLFEGASGDFLLIRGNNHDGTLIRPKVTATVGPKRDSEGFPWWQPKGKATTLQKWGRVNWLQKSPQWQDQQGFRGKHDLERPVGQWNQLECRCRDGSIIIKLNGVIVNHVTNVYPRKGKVLLQCEGAEVFFRKLILHPLKSEGT